MTTNPTKQPICRHCLHPIFPVYVNDQYTIRNANGSPHNCLNSRQDASGSKNDGEARESPSREKNSQPGAVGNATDGE